MSVNKKLLSSQSTIQSLLTENAQLIETIAGFQRIGKYDDVPRYMELLYKNILYLAKLGDPELANQLQQESGLNNNIENQMRFQNLFNSQPNLHTQQPNHITLQQQQTISHSQQQLTRLPTQHHFIAGTLQQPLHQNGTLAATNSIGSTIQYSAQPGFNLIPTQHIPGSINQPLPLTQQYPSTQIQYQSISDALHHHHQQSQNSGPALYSTMYSSAIAPQQPPPT